MAKRGAGGNVRYFPLETLELAKKQRIENRKLDDCRDLIVRETAVTPDMRLKQIRNYVKIFCEKKNKNRRKS